METLRQEKEIGIAASVVAAAVVKIMTICAVEKVRIQKTVEKVDFNNLFLNAKESYSFCLANVATLKKIGRS